MGANGSHRPAEPARGSARPVGIPSPVRASVPFLVLLVLLGGIAYPGAFSELGRMIAPATSAGSLEFYPNGTAYGSSLIAENISNPAMFWPRVSLIGDAAFSGAGDEVPPGPTDPALVNETNQYIAEYGLNNTSVPIDLVSASASGLDPDLYPDAVLVQIPRVAEYSGLSEPFLLSLVNAHIESPILGFLGPQYVNVVDLDVALLPYLPAGTPYTAS